MDIYNKHYIKVQGLMITDGFSDAFRQPEANDICINEQGGYQFKLFADREENPILTNNIGIHLFAYENGTIRPTTEKERAAEATNNLSLPEAPTVEQRTSALESAILAMLGGAANV